MGQEEPMRRQMRKDPPSISQGNLKNHGTFHMDEKSHLFASVYLKAKFSCFGEIYIWEEKLFWGRLI
jgi:hypothetical protein